MVVLVAEHRREVRDAEVVEAALERPGQTELGGGRRVADEDRAAESLAPHRVLGRGDRRVAQRGLVGGLDVEAAHALEVGVGERHVGAGAGHQVGVAGGGPARDPAAVLVLLDETADQLAAVHRVEQRVGGPGGAVGVPEPVVDVGPAGHERRAGLGGRVLLGRLGERARVGVRRRVGGAGVLVEAVGVEVQPVEVGVQRDELVLARALDLDAAEPLVPRPRGALADGLERVVVGDLQPQVAFRLRHADQRGRDPHGHRGLAGRVRLEPQVAGDLAGQEPAPQVAAAGDRAVEGGVEEHPGRAGGQSTSDVGVAGHGAAHGVEHEPALPADVVEDQVGVLAGEGEPQQRRVVGRRDVGADAVGEADAVVVRAGDLVAVPEGQRPRAAPGAGLAGGGRGQHLEGLPVAHPRAGLVADRQCLHRGQVLLVVVALVAVDPVLRAGVGDRGPEVEPVGHRGRRERVAARVGLGRVRAAGGDHVVGGPAGLGLGPVDDRDVVDPAGELGGPGRVVVAEQHLDHDLALGDRADPHRPVVPLAGGERPRLALPAWRPGEAELVGDAELGEPGAVVEGEVDGEERARVAQVVAEQLGEDHVGELGVPRDQHVDEEQLVHHARGAACGVRALVAQRAGAGEPDAGLRGVGLGGPAALPGAHRRAGRAGRALGVDVGHVDPGQRGVGVLERREETPSTHFRDAPHSLVRPPMAHDPRDT